VPRANSNTEEITDTKKRTAPEIHPTAIVDPAATIAPNCRIGPYCTVGPNVEIGEGCELISHVVVDGWTTLGRQNRVFPFASIGLAPQDLKYAGEPTRVEIGEHNTFREGVTVHRGTAGGGGVTRIGNHNLVMAYVHVAHDCRIGDHVILANAATLGGHVVVEDWAMVSALCPIHQYVRIGAHAIIGGGTTLTRDVLPFSKTVAARNTHAYGLNAVGLQRRGFSKERVRKLHHAFKVLLASKLNTSQALERLKAEADLGADVRQVIEFIEASGLGVIK
jgi:UDP-N-acetylglucosamine acyltransferase